MEVSGLVVVESVVSLSGEGGDVFSAEALTVVVCGGTAVVAAAGAPVVSAVRLSDNEPGELAEGACVVVGVGVVLPSRTAVVAVTGEATSPAVVLALTSAGDVLLSAATLVDPSASPSASNARRVR